VRMPIIDSLAITDPIAKPLRLDLLPRLVRLLLPTTALELPPKNDQRLPARLSLTERDWFQLLHDQHGHFPVLASRESSICHETST